MGESRKYLRLTLASGSRFGMGDWDRLESCKVPTEAKLRLCQLHIIGLKESLASFNLLGYTLFLRLNGLPIMLLTITKGLACHCLKQHCITLQEIN